MWSTSIHPVKKKSSADWLPSLGYAFLICIFIVVLTGVSIWQEALRYKEKSEAFTQNTTKLLAQHIGDVFDEANILLQIITYHYNDQNSTGELDATRFSVYLDHLVSLSKTYADIRVLDAAGILRYGSGNAIAPIDLSDRDYFFRLRDGPESLTGGMIAAGPFLTRLTKKWVLVLARRLQNPDGSFAGVVYVNLSNEIFSELFSSINIGPRGAIILRTAAMAQVDRYRRGPNPDAEVGNRKVSQELLDLVQKDPKGGTYRATTNFDQVTRYYSYRKIGDYPFYIIAGEAVGDFMTSMGANIYLLLGFGGAMILLVLIGSRRMYQLTKLQLRERIRQQAERIIEASPIAILVLDEKLVIKKANYAAVEMFGYPMETLVGMPGNRLVSPESIAAAANFAQNGLMQSPLKKQTVETVGLQRNGTEFPMQVSLSSIELGEAPHLILTLQDLTESKSIHEKLKYLAHHDPLTDLPNRILFFERVIQGMSLARRHGSKLALLFLDLDKFKPINDTWGHAVGDIVLQETARRIAACLRESDSVGRVGGDEFVVLLLNLRSPEDAVLIAEKIHTSLNQPFWVDGKNLYVSSSIGIAIFPDHGSDAIELSKNADAAMYYAKANGCDRAVMFVPEMTRDATV